MPNIMDYLTWRGDLTLEASQWNLIDSLIMANFCYNDVGELAATSSGLPLAELAPQLDLMDRTGNIYFMKWRDLLYAMSETLRYRTMRVHDYVDRHSTDDIISQFSAMTIDFENGPTVVAFRGTDASLAGWHEDCNMSFEIVPAQLAAVDYLTQAAEKSDHPLVVVGHSKGGNLAAFACAHASEAVQKRLTSIASFDGPGLDNATLLSKGYKQIEPILTCMIPQCSIVGLLLGYHRDYTFVYSDAKGIFQHDSFTWQLNGPQFQLLPGNNLTSQWLDRTVHKWLAGLSKDDRKAFVETLFSLVDSMHAATTDDLIEDKLHTATGIMHATRNMSPESRKMIVHVLSQMLNCGAANSYDILLRPLLEAMPTIKPVPLPLIPRHSAEKQEREYSNS